MSELYARAGGREGLVRLMTTFYDLVFRDPMIGFLFRRSNRSRLVEKEVELTARALGAEVEYTGRSMREAHARLQILGGQFERRMVLLAEALEHHGMPDDVRSAVLGHARALRPEITHEPGTDCEPSPT